MRAHVVLGWDSGRVSCDRGGWRQGARGCLLWGGGRPGAGWERPGALESGGDSFRLLCPCHRVFGQLLLSTYMHKVPHWVLGRECTTMKQALREPQGDPTRGR